MGSIIRKIFANSTTRVLLIILLCIFAISVYFLVSGYYNQLSLYEEKELDKLQAITQTAAESIDGDAHEILYTHYPMKDQITTTKADPVYYDIYKQLNKLQKVNKLETAMYTLVYKPSVKKFDFVVFSDTIYWRHVWEKFHDEHVTHYKDGGVVTPYTDENGTWLSAFSPIRNKKGEVVAILQADSKFDAFISRARKNILISSLISLGVVGLIGFFLIRSTSNILKKEEKLTLELVEQKKIIELKNQDITDSILYAKRIQEAILPHIEDIKAQLPESFILFMPRDIVSGDFYWYADTDDKIYIAAVDCTGHGVPGALMSMIGNTILTEIIKAKGIKEPAKILDNLEAGIVEAFNQRAGQSPSRDGMDCALISISKDNKTIEFAGAFRPLLLLRDGQLQEVKANRFPIGGGGGYAKTAFTNNVLEIKKGDTVYMFSDGFPDQIGGKSGKKLMTKKFKEILLKNSPLKMEEQERLLYNELVEWQGEEEQMDDILVIGIRFR
jgi:serine phosphatase RsbU (regulator of sigma subunit)